MKKKILFFISQFHKGGAEKSLLELIKAIDKSLFSIDLIIYNQVYVDGAISLIGYLPNDIHVCDVNRMNSNRGLFCNVLRKRFVDGEGFDETAVRFVERKEYDLAIHIGEWHSPEFIGLVVKAKKKICWIHADIDKISSFNPDSFFSYDENIDCYCFVSETSRKAAENKYPFIIGKTGILHNYVNTQEIIELSKSDPTLHHPSGSFLLVSVGNIREEKGYIRALEAIIELKKKGVIVSWWILGHPSNKETVANLNRMISLNGLDNQITFFGARENPYCYMKLADAIISLSDSEAWSLVITEAKVLGVPVISTNTSGAEEQITNGVNGIITSFAPKTIASDLVNVITHPEILTHIRRELKNNPSVPDASGELLELFSHIDIIKNKNKEKDILFITDDINLATGACLFEQIIDLINQGTIVGVYSDTIPTAKTRKTLIGTHFYSFNASKLNLQFKRRLIPGLLSPDMTLSEKRLRLNLFISHKRNNHSFESIILKREYLKQLSAQYKHICYV